jgi:putative transcriptional regulator
VSGPQHHLSEELLLAYASGTAPEAVALFVATHNTLCPTCRARVEALEALGGAMLDAEPREAMDEALLQKVLDRIDEPTTATYRPARSEGDPMLPAPLRAYVGDFDKLRWQRVLPGASQIVLPLAWQEQPVRLSRTRGGFAAPRHTHAGLELHLVLGGGFTEGGEHYERGDVEIGDRGDEHELTIDRGSDCISLVVTSSRLIHSTFAGRLFGAITGL